MKLADAASRYVAYEHAIGMLVSRDLLLWIANRRECSR
jgi:hypothetical protein